MLTFIQGSSGSGKTEFIRQKIGSMLAKKDQRIILIVPEQFSFESERSIHRILGPQKASQVEVASFTRLADGIFREYGGLAGSYADETKKLILMNLAVHELRDSLSFYKKASAYESFTGLMVQTVAELKNAGISPEELEKIASRVESDSLRDKVEDISTLYAAYDALLHKAFFDPLESLSRAAKKVKGTGYFENAAVFVDEFKGFTAGEYELLREIIKQSPMVYVSLCMEQEAQGEYGLFAFVQATRDRLTRIARQAGITVAAPVELLPGGRFSDPELAHFERTVLRPAGEPYRGNPTGGVEFVTAQNEYDEADYAMGAILDLVKSGDYRFRDVAVVTRDLSVYRHVLESAFQKYDIPYYLDERNPIESKPLIRFVRSFLELAARGISTEGALNLFKCGLTPFTTEQVGGLENYCYTWDIRGTGWNSPFIANPSGFAAALTEQDAEALAQANALREYLKNGVDHFCARCGDTARSMSTALYDALEELGVKASLEGIIAGLEQDAQPVLAEDYARVWEILLELLDAVVLAAGEVRLTRARFLELVSLAARESDMGTLPQTLDSVTVGDLSRVRMGTPKAVIVLGANQGVLPMIPAQGGAFSKRERKLLIQSGAELFETEEQTIAEERFLAYKALSAPSHKLIVTARRADVAGTPLRPSELFLQAKSIFGERVAADAQDMGLLFGCRSPRTAFLKLAEHYREDTPETAALREYLGSLPEYRDKAELLRRMLHPAPLRLTDPAAIRGLFGTRMQVSPSRIETFYQCRFRYFCASGLQAKPRTKAELNPMETGSMIHQVLYAVTANSEYDFVTLPEKELRARVREELDRYLETVMGGKKDKTARFTYLYNRMGRTVFQILQHLREEFAQSEFRPSDFELDISPDGEVPPLEVQAPDGTKISIRGRIDRVDTYRSKTTGETYVRVVDYKSGAKKFNLSDLYYGLNLQMLVYLFCIWKNGRGSYQNVLPAGVLYMPAKDPSPTLGREADDASSEKEKRAQYKMNGLLLSDPTLLQAMDKEGGGIFIPAKLNKDGEPDKTSSIVSLGEMGRLYRHTCRLAKDMANELQAGGVEACPINGLGYDPCAYCDFKAVCGVGPEDPRREIQAFSSKEDLFSQMEEEDKQDLE